MHNYYVQHLFIKHKSFEYYFMFAKWWSVAQYKGIVRKLSDLSDLHLKCKRHSGNTRFELELWGTLS